MKQILSLIMMAICAFAQGQNIDITSKLYDSYAKYKEADLSERRIKHSDLQPLIEKLKNNSEYTVKQVGTSIAGKSLNLVSIGKGKTSVFLWSQMHGDEPTATQAIFDIFNFLNSEDFKSEKQTLLSAVTLHFLPMLNPDGAEQFTRRNALGIDINRDALMLQSPEGQTLKRVRDSLAADFGFNLHDQSIYYNAERTDKPATISYLAPAYNYELDINEVRGNAMKVIVFMNSIIQKYAPGQVGRYDDAFEPRAFGDNIQKWGTSTILIESGGYKNDAEKQEIRKLNFVSILSACFTIAKKSYEQIDIKAYETIPENDRKLFDLKIVGATYPLLGKNYKIDLGINHLEIDNLDHSDFYNVGRIIDQGDLSTYYGYEVLDANGYTITTGKIHSKVLKNIDELEALNISDLLKSGITYVRVLELPKFQKDVKMPIQVVSTNFKAPNLNINPGINPTFLLQKNNRIEYAVINGFLIRLNESHSNFTNALILK